jgi:short chain dehydrogenase
MGLALAEHLLSEGADVTIAGRSQTRLAQAAALLRGRPGSLRTASVDIADEQQVRDLLLPVGQLDHVVVTAADGVGAYSPIAEFPLERARAILDTKVLGPLLVAKYARVTGSIVFTSGIAAYRPGPGASAIATANAALEGLAGAGTGPGAGQRGIAGLDRHPHLDDVGRGRERGAPCGHGRSPPCRPGRNTIRRDRGVRLTARQRIHHRHRPACRRRSPPRLNRIRSPTLSTPVARRTICRP